MNIKANIFEKYKNSLKTIYTGLSGASSNTMADKSMADWYLRLDFCGTCCDSTNTEFCLHLAYVGWAVKRVNETTTTKNYPWCMW